MFNFHKFKENGKNEETDEKEMNKELEHTESKSEKEVTAFEKSYKVEKVDGKWQYVYKDTPEEPERKEVEKKTSTDDPNDTEDMEDIDNSKEVERGQGSKKIEDDDEYVR